MRKNIQAEGLPRTLRARNGRAAHLLLALGAAFVLAPAHGADRSGKDVVDSVCAECHATGAGGAPKIGDRQAWSGRAAQGLTSLTRHALDGIRNMPAHGGRSDLSDLEIARAVTYMVNRSGGNWVEPLSMKDLAAERSGEGIVKSLCINCHGEGVGGAPKIGDLQAWVPRVSHGIPYLVRSAIRGHGGMPPRGGQANLTDSEIRSAILYMYNPAGAPARASSGAARPRPAGGSDPNHKTVGGIDIYLGFLPAQNLYKFPKGSPERSMHGGIPKGSGYYHLNVSLFDERTGAPIDDAKVHVQLEWPGKAVTKIELEPMPIGAGGYGNFVKPQPGASYLLSLRIDRPGAARTVEAEFEHRFD